MSTALSLFPTANLGVQGDAVFARNGTIRRQIRRWWVERPKRWAAWLMLNPSIAGKDRNDQTALRCTHFSRVWGYDGWIGVNLYPFVSSDPREMWRWAAWDKNGPDWYARDDMQTNLRDIEEVARMSCLRMAAFGAAPVERNDDWLEQCLEAFQQPFDCPDSGWVYDEGLYCLGVTKSGQPLHPMARGRCRVADNAQPVLWREV